MKQVLKLTLEDAKKMMDSAINKAIEWAHEIAQSAPLSLAAIKAVIRETDQMDLESAYETMRSGQIRAYHRMLKSEDAKEGPLAFSEIGRAHV